MSRLRIVIIQDYLRGGGTEKHSVLLANHFASRGNPTTLVTFRPGGVLSDRLKTGHYVLQPVDYRLNFLAPGLIRTLKGLAPDVVLAMGHEANMRLGKIKSALPDVSVIGTLRASRLRSRQLLRNYRQADRVIANSKWARQQLITKGVPQAQVEVINNMLGFAKASGSGDGQADGLRESLSKPADKTLLVNVAGFRKGKGQAELLTALQGLLKGGGHTLWLVGEGPLRASCEKLARILEIEPHVRFWGRCNDVEAILSHADIMVHTSRFESQPNALIEAQACGVPVVAWDFAGVGETFEHGRSGLLVAHGDVHGLVQGVLRLSQDHTLRKAFARYAAEFAWIHFDDSTNGDRYLELFADMKDTSG